LAKTVSEGLKKIPGSISGDTSRYLKSRLNNQEVMRKPK
jgi:hypothetical protein